VKRPGVIKRRQTWTITKRGIYNRDYYFIAADRYDERDHSHPQRSSWIMHIARKSEESGWDLELFVDAFRRGVERAGVSVGFDWQASTEAARAIREYARSFKIVEDELFPRRPRFELLSLDGLEERDKIVRAEMRKRGMGVDIYPD